MDEDEEVDREGGGRKMSDHLVLFLLHNNTHLQAISYFSNLDKTFANPKSMCKGVALTGAFVAHAPFSSSFDLHLGIIAQYQAR